MNDTSGSSSERAIFAQAINEREVFDAFVHLVPSIPEVKAVVGFSEGRLLHIITVVDDWIEESVEQKIYDAELHVGDQYDQVFELDFQLLSLHGRPLTEFLSPEKAAAIVYQRPCTR